MKRRPTHAKLRGINITRLLKRDGAMCPLCDLALDRRIDDERDPMYVTFDHIVPKSSGGLDVIANLRLAHKVCNNERGSGRWAGRAHAGQETVTFLGALNFLVLQWFGVRLCAGFNPREISGWHSDRINDVQIASFGGRWWSRTAPPSNVRVSWSLLRWVWPLSGWWSDYRWIARRK